MSFIEGEAQQDYGQPITLDRQAEERACCSGSRPDQSRFAPFLEAAG
jgi:hypothetical protein